MIARLVGLGVLAGMPFVAVAQGLSGLDSSQPIEITADQLEVVQGERLATFSGNVDAVQGEMVLRADQLRVHYGDDGGQTASASSVRLIEAEGNVVLTAPGDSAKGRRGTYDVEQGRITLEEEVVLTSGDNVIRGDRLDYDVTSGKAVVRAGGAGAPGRVRALFVPEESG